MPNLLNCGYNNYLHVAEIESILSYRDLPQATVDSFDGRTVDITNENNLCIRSVILLKGGSVYLCSLSPETLAQRMEG